MRFRSIALAAYALFVAASRAFGQPAPPELQREAAAAESGWTFVVIELRYADAEQIASVLRELLPPTVRVVAYPPTNTVLISGDQAVIEDLEASDLTKERANN